MNLIPTLENPSLPKEITMGWHTIQKYKTNKLPFLDAYFLDQTISEKRKNEHYSARKLFGNLVDYLDLPANSIQLMKTDLGKPYAMNGNTMIYTSFSHSEDWVLSGLSLTFDFGIDCERVDRTIDPKIFDRILHEKEKSIVNEQHYLAIWTMKEAVVKCLGIGIRSSLKNYPLIKDIHRYVVNYEHTIIYVVPFIWLNHQIAIAWRG